MSSHEIEDVLSSIRRLVSEDLRPAPRAPATPEQADTAASDKLLLTPALRVVAEPDAPDPTDFAATEPEAETAPVEDVVSRLGAAVTEDEWESPFGDPEIWPGSAQADVSDSVAQGFVARARVPLTTPSEDQGADDMPEDFMQSPMAAYAEVEDVLDDPSSAPPAPARESLRTVTPPQDDSDWAEAAEAAVRADLAHDVEDEVILGLDDVQAGGMFDEDVLRDLVRDLIRDELTGALGERITRNVRKLVRAEIARAMALRDFE
ncbi:MAG: hypothetical protein U0934_14300 [Pseudotabrizicola sp.]|uniref:hypothetical protein n=1 Tax=Pseudotabrizicola sp. TaxID=2939647 RepID=UPI002717806C|nr:hypothetical protein [Pseudotabrizicola sp.]MDO8883249.1 hypothetical protein [Pseudotabrizicola sp.]MDP2080959.1 hypothetical protein [Pseudotabrizicola sp.]MDZ7575103.1 hypothetical protein [Pseudotabrizicola sp.]